MNEKEIQKVFTRLWHETVDEPIFPPTRLLAHYTSIETLEAMVRSGEFWMSNPLCMNDHEELRFGLDEAAKLFSQHEGIRLACKSDHQYVRLKEAFDNKLFQLRRDDAFDIYVMCFSEHHEEEDADGKLSMWRGYGGNGNGVALVFDTSKWPSTSTGWLVLAKVNYGSAQARRQWINEKLNQFAVLLAEHDIDEEMYYIAVHYLLERFKLFALFSKHHGFREEKEWRLVYIKSFDENDSLRNCLGYSVGQHGVEPKLKLKLSELSDVLDYNVSLESSVHQIILGPSIATPLMAATVERMLEVLNHSSLAPRVVRSGTPYRVR